MRILIPCKDLDRGKSRLAPQLDPAARRALCESFLARTLALATTIASATAVHLVTGDPAAVAIAAHHGVRSLPDDGADLNAALAQARVRLLAELSHPSDVLILPIDLPDATPDALADLLASSATVAIAPDRERQGTNVLRLRATALADFPFAFGAGSFARHCAAAESMKLTLQVVADPRLAFDIDQPSHYDDWLRRTRQPQRVPL